MDFKNNRLKDKGGEVSEKLKWKRFASSFSKGFENNRLKDKG